MTNVQDSDCFYWYTDYLCAWGSSPEELAWNHHLWDFNTTTTIAGALTPFGASDGMCGISSTPVPCFTRSLSDDQMARAIQVDDFSGYTDQTPDATWPSGNLNPWPVPSSPNLEPARAVLDGETQARDWVDRQLTTKPSLQTPPQVFGFANEGQTLIGSRGEWNSADATSASVHWLRCDAAGASCVDLYGTTSDAYPVTAADAGSTLRFKVTASNAAGSATAISDPSPLVLAPIAQLATDYRPALLLDSTEHYRPITVESLLGERDGSGNPVHKHCDVVPPPPPLTSPLPVCYAVGSVDDLVAPPRNQDASRSFLSIWTPNGDPSDENPYSGDATDFRSPTCASDSLLRDCGDTPGIYYHYGQSVHGYRFIDYWIFYRYNPFPNPFPIPDDNHEGDWEGLTVELDPSPNPPAVTGIVLDQHGHLAWRLPSAFVWCEDGAASQANCDTAPVSPSGVAHAGVFVAEGSHASYENSCTQECFNPVGDNIVHEHRHDGQAGWVDNSSSSCADDSARGGCVAGLGAWAAWTGCWGGSGTCSDDIIPYGTSPRGPAARQGGRYGCTEVGWACSETPEGGPVPFSLHKGTKARSQRVTSPARLSLEEKCSSWTDSELAASACSPTDLRLANERHQLSKPGQFALLISGRRTATAPGLVQVVGSPLRVGESIRLRGTTAKDEAITLTCRVGKKFFVIRLRAIRTGSHAMIKIIGNGRQPHVLLHHMAATASLTVVSSGRAASDEVRSRNNRHAR
jgi:hypothetical protein